MQNSLVQNSSAQPLAPLPRQLFAIGFHKVWQPYVRAFLRDSQVTFVTRPDDVPASSVAVIWGTRDVSLNANVQLIRLEDGFLRSVGLGVQFAKPLSWVVDRQGMYFDPRQPSDLEHMLNTAALDDTQHQRARALIDGLVNASISKYNTGSNGWQLPEAANASKVILVPGQVETDASIRLGAPDICTNAELVRAVRAANPNAFIIYKPHPDVVSKGRKVGSTEHQASNAADAVVTDANISDVINQVDEVHVITSLAGFEALLRNKPVTCYGVPFYAGWGLTTDACNHPVALTAFARRTRTLTVEQLAHGALIDYPIYLSRDHQHVVDAEATLATLKALKRQQYGVWARSKNFGKAQLRRLINRIQGAK